LDYGRLEEETVFSYSGKLRIQRFLPVIDRFLSLVDQRLKAYDSTCSLFVFCLNWNHWNVMKS